MFRAWLLWGWPVMAFLTIAVILKMNLLDRFPSPVFPLIWATVGVIGVFNRRAHALDAEHQRADPLVFQSFLVGLLLGSILGTARWVPVDISLLADLFVALSPLFTYPDLFRWVRTRVIKGLCAGS